MVTVKIHAVYGSPKLAKSGKTYWRKVLVQFPTSDQPDMLTVLGDENILAAMKAGENVQIQPGDMAFA